MMRDVISLLSVKELVLWNKNNTEIIIVIIKEILYASLHRKRGLACLSPSHSIRYDSCKAQTLVESEVYHSRTCIEG